MIRNVNGIANYDRYHTRDICKAARELTSEQKQMLLERIRDTKIMSMLLSKDYDVEADEYIEKLLNGKRPRNGMRKNS